LLPLKLEKTVDADAPNYRNANASGTAFSALSIASMVRAAR
jgi:hypothetical protein